MENSILGLHHITAIASDARKNYDFYTRVLGLRLVKKTVNFDDPGTYHFYFGDEMGTPGSLLTFFPWEGVGKGRTGPGMATRIAFAVPAGSLDYWEKRFSSLGVSFHPPVDRWNETCLDFQDPDGLMLSLVIAGKPDTRRPWTGGTVEAPFAIRGFHGVNLTVRKKSPTTDILTNVFGYTLLGEQETHYRYVTDSVDQANIVDVTLLPDGHAGINAAGTNHHVAFRVRDEKVQAVFREKILSLGLSATPRIDRDYFYSVYFREPGGILFELATDNPGFTVDEPLENLGTSLKLPPHLESVRADIEKALPPL